MYRNLIKTCLLTMVFAMGFKAQNGYSQSVPAVLQDSLALIALLNTNCQNCPLTDSTSVFFWETQYPVRKWPGVKLMNGRVDSLILDGMGLSGNISSLSVCTELSYLNVENTASQVIASTYLNQLTGLPAMDSLSKLEELYFRGNRVEMIPMLNGCASLRIFDGAGNELRGGFGLDSCRNLEELDLSENLLDSLPGLYACQKLKELDVRGNDLASLPTLDSLQSLETLHCQRNRLTVIPDLSPCSNLRIIDCHQNKLTSLPNLNNCPNLESLDCHNNENLTTLPNLNFKLLETLNVSGDSLVCLPPFDSLFNLKTLDCSDNYLTEIPSLDNCNNLKILDCHSNNLAELPSLIGCPLLTELYFNSNRVDSFPQTGNLMHLEILNCDSNDYRSGFVRKGLKNLPCLDSCSNLLVLKCGWNLISDFPSLSACSSLNELSCNSNKIKTLPSLENCRLLGTLNCEFNQLTEIPNLNKCNNLRVLNCDENPLISFPSLDSCPLLIVLDCAANNLTALPFIYTNVILSIECDRNQLNFDDLEPIHFLDSLSEFVYFPQGNFRIQSPPSVLLRIDSFIVLSASQAGGDSSKYQWLKNGQPILGGNDSLLKVDVIHGSGDYRCEVTNTLLPDLTLKSNVIEIQFDPGVVCGDANQDGIINMMDLAVLGLYYGDTGKARNQIPVNDTTPAAAYDWQDPLHNKKEFKYGGNQINLKHGDCNGDGRLDSLDLICIDWFYEEPLALPSFLQNAVEPGMSLSAKAESHRIEVVEEEDELKVRIPYRISFESFPGELQTMKVRGVIFTRPVSRTDFFSVDTIWANFRESDFLPDSVNGIWLQKFHPDIEIQPVPGPGGTACYSDGLTNPLDVGIFRKDSAISLSPGHSCISCIVTLDEIFSPFNQNQSYFDSLPVFLQTINVVIYAENENGDIVPMAAKCTGDTTYLNADSILHSIQSHELLSECGEVRAEAYPNPVRVNEIISICIPLEKEGSVSLGVFNSAGKIIRKFRTNLNAHRDLVEIPIENWRPGWYFIRIESPNWAQKVQVLKILVFP